MHITLVCSYPCHVTAQASGVVDEEKEAERQEEGTCRRPLLAPAYWCHVSSSAAPRVRNARLAVKERLSTIRKASEERPKRTARNFNEDHSLHTVATLALLWSTRRGTDDVCRLRSTWWP